MGFDKNKKGFTLIEILIVIIIIGLVLLVVLPSITLISNSIKERNYESKIILIEEMAEEYAKNNKDIFGEEAQIELSVKTLLNHGYLKPDATKESRECGEEDYNGCIINPINNTSINNNIVVIKKNISIYEATYI